MKSLQITAAVAIATTVLIGCGGGPETTEAEAGSNSAATVGEPTEQASDIEPFFEALSSYDPDRMEDAENLATDGSIAQTYVKHLRFNAMAAIDSGAPAFESSTLTEVDGGYESCDPIEADACVVWADIEVEAGKVSSFTVDGEALDKRLSAGAGKEAPIGDLGKVEFLTAYQSVQANQMVINLKVSSGGRGLSVSDLYSATYRAPDGRQATTSDADLPVELGPDSTAYVTLAFDRAQPGGELSFSMFDTSFTTEGSATLATR